LKWGSSIHEIGGTKTVDFPVYSQDFGFNYTAVK
jgi:hypothetical protein